eukprot:bmy_12980T0
MTNAMKNHRCHSTIRTPMINIRKSHPLIKVINNAFIDLPTSYLFNSTIPNRLVPSNTLHTRHNNCLLISNTHLPRR